MTDVDQLEDVVYGYKDGMGLVMDVFTSRDPRVDAGVIVAVSGGWSTDLARRRNLLNDPEEWGILPRCLLDAGYVVFAVAHSRATRSKSCAPICPAPCVSSGTMPGVSISTRGVSGSWVDPPVDT
ncbi:MAG TPA: hypothetical protein QGF95_22620 [Candidatus Latescibacteria bacterium]|nr:hypothetical protein [Gemmatimonadaceae bacterium]HJP33352.1 hypothetical protein [Candidatus Latescibacterota bacterium]